MSVRWGLVAVGVGLWALMLSGCGSSDEGVRIEGSDTMVNVAQAWAEQYHAEPSRGQRAGLGGGSGVGIASLIDGNCDMANASRKMEAKRDRAGARPSAAPSPRRSSSATTPWPSTSTRTIRWTRSPWRNWPRSTARAARSPSGRNWASTARRSATTRSRRVSRQNSSGTYAYFREAVLGQGQGLQARLDRPERLEGRGGPGVAARPSAIGYSGMGYATPEVKMLEDLEATRASRAWRPPSRTPSEQRRLSHHAAAADLHRRRAGRRRSRSISTGSWRRKARRSCSNWATCPSTTHE